MSISPSGLLWRQIGIAFAYWNAQTPFELADCDIGVVPSQWQRQQFPAHLASKLKVIHEGIDVETLGALA